MWKPASPDLTMDGRQVLDYRIIPVSIFKTAPAITLCDGTFVVGHRTNRYLASDVDENCLAMLIAVIVFPFDDALLEFANLRGRLRLFVNASKLIVLHY